MKRLVIFRNGSRVDGKVILVAHGLDELLSQASAKFHITATRVFNPHGGEIDDIILLRDEDVLYISQGEPFQPVRDSGCIGSSAPTSTSRPSDWVTLNVGGRHFSTTRSTLTTKCPDSMLARMFAEDGSGHSWCSTVDKRGAYLIDRSPRYFEPILNYLRHGELILDEGLNPEGVLEEARFYGIDPLVQRLTASIQEMESGRNLSTVPLTRRDVVSALITTSLSDELRFQGVNVAGADLSRLDLRNINFKYAVLRGANLAGANLSFCCLERADLSRVNLEGAQLLGVKMLCANLEGANLRACNFEDPAGTRANMEGCNLKNASLEGSHLTYANLRVATLKHANMQNCDLRGASLAGADLEHCDLSGSDLHEANLRGANLKDVTMELMVTPLHMAQAIR